MVSRWFILAIDIVICFVCGLLILDEINSATRKTQEWMRKFTQRPKTAREHKAELGIEFCGEMVIVFFQLGRELMGLPVNVPLGAGCWVIAMLVAVRILWILPLTAQTPILVKALTGLVIFAVAVTVSYSTMEEAYRKQRAGEQLTPDAKILLAAFQKLQSIVSVPKEGTAQTSAKEPNPKPINTRHSRDVLHSVPGFVLVQIAPYVSNAIREFDQKEWYNADHEIELHSWADHEFEQRRQNGDTGAPTPEHTQQEWDEQEKEVNAQYRSEFVQLLVVADALRDALLNKLPSEAQTTHDKAQIAAFGKARSEAGSPSTTGTNCCPSSTMEAAKYLDDLSARVARIKTLTSR